MSSTVLEQMRQAAAGAPALLPDGPGPVVRFLRSRMNRDGGFADRSAQRKSDLYYTVFGLEGLRALGAELPLDSLADYLHSFGDGAGLDLVHLVCLARCWTNFPGEQLTADRRSAILGRIESFRSADGGYNQAPGSARGSAYGCLLALGAYQDIGCGDAAMRGRGVKPLLCGMLDCVAALRTGDGAYSNETGRPIGLTPATAAAVSILDAFGQPIDPAVGQWLLGCLCPDGGFAVMPVALLGLAMPDLLSTATALHTLATLDLGLTEGRQATIRFIGSLRSSEGGFVGPQAGDLPDCEYTFYALLSLGHLAAK